MKRYLLPEGGQFYKANLHCHTNYSDGKFSPQEVKDIYMKDGYSIIAYTDHELFIAHPELRDEHFLPLNAVEMDITEHIPVGSNKFDKRTCHLCMIALEESTELQPCWHRTKYASWNENLKRHNPEVKFDDTQPDYERIYTVKGINDMIRRYREAGFFVTYNHPIWSLELPEDYLRYEGMNAMEIYNHSSYHVVGCDEYVPHIYDAFLRLNKRIYALATDDNHSERDVCGGYVMIKAPALEYRTVTKALEAGDFYASNGAQIKSLWFEDGKIHVECAPAARIVYSTGVRRNKAVNCAEGTLTEASFEVAPEDIFARITVYTKDGKFAHTNAYFVDDLLGKD